MTVGAFGSPHGGDFQRESSALVQTERRDRTGRRWGPSDPGHWQLGPGPSLGCEVRVWADKSPPRQRPPPAHTAASGRWQVHFTGEKTPAPDREGMCLWSPGQTVSRLLVL